VNITSPANGSAVSGSVPVVIDAWDNFGVSKAELYVDGSLRKTSTDEPFTNTLDTSGLSQGPHVLSVKAYDEAGNAGVSADVTVNVGSVSPTSTPVPTNTPTLTPAPTVTKAPTSTPVPTAVPGGSAQITSPRNGDTVITGSQVSIQALVSSSFKANSTEFYVNNVRICTDRKAPYSCNWKVPSAPNTQYSIEFRAFGRAGSVARDTVIVTSSATSTTQPTSGDMQSVTISDPSDNSNVQIRSTITLTAKARDNSTINKVEFYVDGTILCIRVSAPYSCYWKVPSRSGVAHTIQARAYDNSGSILTNQITVNTVR
jgi:hypothetical protein